MRLITEKEFKRRTEAGGGPQNFRDLISGGAQRQQTAEELPSYNIDPVTKD